MPGARRSKGPPWLPRAISHEDMARGGRNSAGMERHEASEFVCARCGNCCRGDGYVRITPEEAAKVAEFLGLNLEAFLADYTRTPEIEKHAQAGDYWLIDRFEPEQACVFLEANGCLIQPVKPVHCQGFPLRWRTPNAQAYCKGLQG